MKSRGHDVWTRRDLSIVSALTVRCRLMSLEQIAANWWPLATGSVHNVTRSLNRLIDAGLLDEFEVDIEMLPQMTKPLASWRPGIVDEAIFDPQKISHQLQSRWHGQSQRCRVYAPTALAAHLYGSLTHGLHDPLQATHDVHVAELYLLYRRRDPTLAEHWRGEGCFRKAGFALKDPDAFLVDSAFKPTFAVEFGGKYPAERVAAFDDHCRTHALPYELW